jgi:hypothetical protein
MRLGATVSVTVIAAVAATAAAFAGPTSSRPDAIDISARRQHLEVLTDGDGHYLVVDRRDDESEFFYGDAAHLELQEVRSSFVGGDPDWRSIVFWTPRTRSTVASLTVTRAGAWSISCGDRETRLVPADAATAGKILERARFTERRWRRTSVAIGRDAGGVFYYVDRLQPKYGVGYRLFVGKKGRMTARRLLDVVDDSVGMVLYTAGGALWLEPRQRTGRWRKGKQREELTMLDPETSGPLIWEELGVYRGESVGVPCDDL